MQIIQVADLKANFSEVLQRINNEQEEYIIQYGRKHKKVAVLIPYETYKKSHSKIKLGILSNKSKYKICDDFELTDDEFLGL